MPPRLSLPSRVLSYAIKPIKAAVNVLLLPIPREKKVFLSATDKAYRYRRVVKEIRRLKEGTIIEVGGGSEGLHLFYRGDITILDVSAYELHKAKKAGLKTIHADGCEIPSQDSSFDIAVSVASLEHVPREKRAKYVDELKRVCRNGVVLYVPSGKEAERFDRALLSFRSFLGISNDWTEEHVRYGIPTIKELKKMFPGCEITMIQNSRLWLKVLKLEAIPIINLILPGIYYSLNRKKDDRPPFYGALVVWKKKR